MLNSLGSAIARARRTLTQQGVRGILRVVVQRVRTGNLSLRPMQTPVIEGTHPFDGTALGLDTAGLIRGSQLATGHPHDIYNTAYYGTAPSLFRNVLDRWRSTPGTHPVEACTFIDLGSGKGRVILLASELPFRQCVGVELNRSLHEIACVNIERWQAAGKAVSPLQPLCIDATSYTFPSTPCVVYLFNPFTTVVFERLLTAIATAFANRPNELDLLYVNAEYAALLQAHPGFRLLWQMPVTMSPEDASVDLLYMADESGRKPYGIEGQEPCSAWRWVCLQPPSQRPSSS